MNLPIDKKLVKVEFTYNDGSKYSLDELNSEKYNKNIEATGLMALRGHVFNKVEWNSECKLLPPELKFSIYEVRDKFYQKTEGLEEHEITRFEYDKLMAIKKGEFGSPYIPSEKE